MKRVFTRMTAPRRIGGRPRVGRCALRETRRRAGLQDVSGRGFARHQRRGDCCRAGSAAPPPARDAPRPAQGTIRALKCPTCPQRRRRTQSPHALVRGLAREVESRSRRRATRRAARPGRTTRRGRRHATRLGPRVARAVVAHPFAHLAHALINTLRLTTRASSPAPSSTSATASSASWVAAGWARSTAPKT